MSNANENVFFQNSDTAPLLYIKQNVTDLNHGVEQSDAQRVTTEKEILVVRRNKKKLYS